MLSGFVPFQARCLLRRRECDFSDVKCFGVCTGAASHCVDEAYEEAAFLKTNRFLAAYVVDEQNRASYINDHLNESFLHVRFQLKRPVLSPE